ncbi:hypothetical protein LOK49_LG08G00190 [Camellia lanceoleosa]|uniref:Uncharacterized protein n=1 Tax=Camellia lanceoleosa TaxID=1840588 RepID=A0ACC0GWK1_9ERIC|nr:hypothetical protein LOK49_LG08G00190 [Camellia lanceoleosa]
MPWGTPPLFSTRRRTRAAERAPAAAEEEKSKERDGMVKLGLGLGFGSGFLRWWSLIRSEICRRLGFLKERVLRRRHVEDFLMREVRKKRKKSGR